MGSLYPDKMLIPLGTVDASGPDTRPVFVATERCRLLGASIVDVTAKTGHANNYGTYALIDMGTDGSEAVTVATRATDTPTTDDIAAYVEWPLTLNTTPANLELEEGTVLIFSGTEAGSATSGDLVDALLVISYQNGYGGGV